MAGQIVILAGGLGTRLRPLTEKIPKPLIEIAGKPFLHWQLSDISQQGYRRVMLLVAYLGEQIEDAFGDGKDYGLEISYVYESAPLGTGGAIRQAFDQLDETFVLLNGDSFLKTSIQDMEKAFRASSFSALISAYDNALSSEVIDNLKVDGNRVIDYKKSGGRDQGYNYVDSGIYILQKSIFNKQAEEAFSLESLWPELIANKKLGIFEVSECFYDIGTPEKLKKFERKIYDYFPYTHAY